MACAPINLFDLPIEGIMVDYVSKYLYFEDLLNFRVCSRKCREVADKMLRGMDRLFIYNFHELEWKFRLGYPFIVGTVSHLKIISLGGLSNFNDNLLMKLLKNSPLLEIFFMKNCPVVTARGIVPLATHCKNLRHLMLQCVPVGDNFLHTFALHNKKLETLNLFSNRDCTSRGLQRFLGKQPHLRNITLDEVGIFQRFPMRPILNLIARKCKNVEYLSFNCCYDVEDDVVINLVDELPKLKNIHIDKNRKTDVDDEEFTTKSINYLIDHGISHEKSDEIQKMEDILDGRRLSVHKEEKFRKLFADFLRTKIF